eukprot:2213577-Pleurochrysis_carterae.AAC.1
MIDDAASAAAAALAPEMTTVKLPPQPDWERLQSLPSGKVQLSKARQADIYYLFDILTIRTWRVDDVAEALLAADLLSPVFTPASWRSASFSFRQLEKIRQFLTLKYDSDCDRYLHPILFRFGSNFFMRTLKPIPARNKWFAMWKAVKKQLRIEVDSEGNVASRRLNKVLQEMINDHGSKGMTRSGAGDTADDPIEIVFMFDAFPVEMISVSHFCVGNASLRQEMSSMSEQLLRAITCGRIPKTNSQLRTALQHNDVSVEFNNILRDGGLALPPTASSTDYTSSPVFVHLKMYIAADKKAVEAWR